jgi:uncharacterized SAM-binding protein YcdF (DUF218 family)
MVRRVLSLLLLVWAFGFLWFAVTLPHPAPDARTDAVFVLTGGKGRVERGVDLLQRHQAPRLLVSGVGRSVRPAEFQQVYHVPPALMQCCVTLGFAAFDTRSNAREAARWVAANRVRSVRLVTSDWHMRRARFELDRRLPPGIAVIEDAVRSEPSLRILFLEYNKLLARWLQALWQR